MELLCTTSLGWFSALLHSGYWLGVLYYQHYSHNKISITDIRLQHYGMMGYGCLVYTAITLIMWLCLKCFRKGKRRGGVYGQRTS